MRRPTLLLGGAEIVLLATAVLFLAFQDLWHTLIGVSCVGVVLVLVGWLVFGHLPDGVSLTGMAVICASGVMVALSTRRAPEKREV